MKSQEVKPTSEALLEMFFRRDHTGARLSFIRPVLNVVVKGLYVCGHLISFILLDNVLNGEYIEYGIRWFQWSKMKNSVMHDYMGMREFPKPGNRLLPPFGYCEFYETARDVKQSKSNKIKLVCEISQHVLFQYCLLILWFAIVVGILVSVFGFIHQVGTYLSYAAGSKKKGLRHGGMTLREMDYIAYIKSRDNNIHHEIIRTLVLEEEKEHDEKLCY